MNLGSVSSPLCVCETRKRYVVKHNLCLTTYLFLAAHESSKIVSLKYRPSLPPGNFPGSHFC